MKTYDSSYWNDLIPSGTYFIYSRVVWQSCENRNRYETTNTDNRIVKINKPTSLHKLEEWIKQSIEKSMIPNETINHIKIMSLNKIL